MRQRLLGFCKCDDDDRASCWSGYYIDSNPSNGGLLTKVVEGVVEWEIHPSKDDILLQGMLITYMAFSPAVNSPLVNGVAQGEIFILLQDTAAVIVPNVPQRKWAIATIRAADHPTLPPKGGDLVSWSWLSNDLLWHVDPISNTDYFLNPVGLRSNGNQLLSILPGAINEDDKFLVYGSNGNGSAIPVPHSGLGDALVTAPSGSVPFWRIEDAIWAEGEVGLNRIFISSERSGPTSLFSAHAQFEICLTNSVGNRDVGDITIWGFDFGDGPDCPYYEEGNPFPFEAPVMCYTGSELICAMPPSVWARTERIVGNSLFRYVPSPGVFNFGLLPGVLLTPEIFPEQDSELPFVYTFEPCTNPPELLPRWNVWSENIACDSGGVIIAIAIDRVAAIRVYSEPTFETLKYHRWMIRELNETEPLLNCFAPLVEVTPGIPGPDVVHCLPFEDDAIQFDCIDINTGELVDQDTPYVDDNYAIFKNRWIYDGINGTMSPHWTQPES